MVRCDPYRGTLFILLEFFIQPHCREWFKLCHHLTGFRTERTTHLPSTFRVD
ncbi:hypothetical protein [Salmonella phage SD-1_S14]|nr:hypothetical protein [Salmonella phage SD-1_S14]